MTLRTQEVAAAALADGVTPLDVALRAMRDHFAAGRYDEAAARAKDAAPYLHPRLSAVEVKTTIKRSLSDVTTDELLALAAEQMASADQRRGLH